MESGKFVPTELSKRNSFAFQKRKTVTPTPRRNSLQHTERKRLSVLSNFNSNPQSNHALTARPKSQDALTSHNTKSSSMVMKKVNIKNDLCVKGKVIKHEDNDPKKKSKKLLLDK